MYATALNERLGARSYHTLRSRAQRARRNGKRAARLTAKEK